MVSVTSIVNGLNGNGIDPGVKRRFRARPLGFFMALMAVVVGLFMVLPMASINGQNPAFLQIVDLRVQHQIPGGLMLAVGVFKLFGVWKDRRVVLLITAFTSVMMWLTMTVLMMLGAVLNGTEYSIMTFLFPLFMSASVWLFRQA